MTLDPSTGAWAAEDPVKDRWRSLLELATVLGHVREERFDPDSSRSGRWSVASLTGITHDATCCKSCANAGLSQTQAGMLSRSPREPGGDRWKRTGIYFVTTLNDFKSFIDPTARQPLTPNVYTSPILS